jgi:hypothetical protein
MTKGYVVGIVRARGNQETGYYCKYCKAKAKQSQSWERPDACETDDCGGREFFYATDEDAPEPRLRLQ